MSLTGHRNPPTSQLTRVRMFLNPEPFFRIQNFHVYTYPYSNRIGPSTRIRHVSGCTLVRPQDSLGNIGKRACVEKRAKFASCSALCHDSRFYRSNYDRIRTEIKEKCEEQGSFTRNEGCHLKQYEYNIYGKELGSIFLRYRVKNNLDLAYTRFRIHSVLNNVYCFGERIQEVADSNAGYTGYVWTEAVSGKKKLRFQKYLGTCGWGLKLWLGNKNCTINTKLKKCSLYKIMFKRQYVR